MTARKVLRAATAGAVGFSFAALTGAAFGAADRVAQLQAEIAAARSSLVAHLPSVSDDLRAIPGLFSRLDKDAANLNASARPPWMSENDFWSLNSTMVHLDTSLVNQLVTRKLLPVAGVSGAQNIVFRSKADGRLQPFGLFVPQSYSAGRPAALVVMLHGQGQTESDVISAPAFQTLGNSAGAIIAAPYARGDAQYADPAPADIIQIVDIVETAYNIDRSRVFLAGISMGGFGAFHVAARNEGTWAGLLSIIGGIDSRDGPPALAALKGKRVFIVAAADDEMVGVETSRRAKRDLQSAGIDVHYYEQPNARHTLNDVFPAVLQAWSDMLRSGHVVILPTPPPQTKTAAALPTAIPIAPPPPGQTPAPRGTPP